TSRGRGGRQLADFHTVGWAPRLGDGSRRGQCGFLAGCRFLPASGSRRQGCLVFRRLAFRKLAVLFLIRSTRRPILGWPGGRWLRRPAAAGAKGRRLALPDRAWIAADRG